MRTDELVFVDRLGVGGVFWLALSWLYEGRQFGASLKLFVVDGVSHSARMLAALLRVFGIRIEIHELDFDFMDDVRLEDGTRAIDEVWFNASLALLPRMECDSEYASSIRQLATRTSHEPYIHAYCSKRMFFDMYPELRSVQVVAWYSRTKLGAPHLQSVFYVRHTPLLEVLSEYAAKWNIDVRGLPGGLIPLGRLVRVARPLLVRAYGWVVRSFGLARVRLDGDPPRVAAQMYFNGVGLEPIYNSEFFWHRKSKLPAGAVFGYFADPRDQPSEPRQALLKNAGIGWINRRDLRRLMHGRSSLDVGPAVKGVRRQGVRAPAERSVRRVLREYIQQFYLEYDRWRRFLDVTGVRVHVSTYDVFPSSEALHAALRELGGVSVSIQRSIECEPYIIRRTVTDVHFASSRAQVELEHLSGSCVRQFIVVGYPFDYAFGEARTYASRLVSQLRARGVTFIVCFLDENDGVHRKRLGGAHTRGDYGFLCDRVSADRTLGLILKPKRPDTLRWRLGSVWPRVKQLIDSGRCILLDGQSLDTRYLPCVAACAADVAINELYGGSAGLEAYLAGTRTLLVRHDARREVFERLPAGSVVFDSWEQLWEAVERLRANPADPLIGNWKPIIEEFASLRDGRASERIQSYITWLYEAFASGKSREEAMEYAGSRYAATWGPDLITEISQPFLYQSAMADTRSTTEVDG